MSTTTNEFTKERLREIIETDHVQCGDASALARIALLSLEAGGVTKLDVDIGSLESYSITKFGVLLVTENHEGDLNIVIRDFDFDRINYYGGVVTPHSKRMTEKYALQAILNRLRSYCDNYCGDE